MELSYANVATSTGYQPEVQAELYNPNNTDHEPNLSDASREFYTQIYSSDYKERSYQFLSPFQDVTLEACIWKACYYQAEEPSKCK